MDLYFYTDKLNTKGQKFSENLGLTTGTWAPVLTYSSGLTKNLSYTRDACQWYKLGKLVFIWANVTITDAGVGKDLLVQQLPFKSSGRMMGSVHNNGGKSTSLVINGDHAFFQTLSDGNVQPDDIGIGNFSFSAYYFAD